MEEKIFKYKLDFYYQQSLMYLLTSIIYAGIRGSFIENKFEFVFRDPILYIILFFVLLSFVSLLLNTIRNKRIIIDEHKITFKTRFRERFVAISEIEWIHIGKERSVRTAGRTRMVLLKIKTRKRAFRIRIGRYELAKELLEEMQHIAERVPRRTKRRFGKRN